MSESHAEDILFCGFLLIIALLIIFMVGEPDIGDAIIFCLMGPPTNCPSCGKAFYLGYGDANATSCGRYRCPVEVRKRGRIKANAPGLPEKIS